MGYSAGGKALFPIARSLEESGRVVSKIILLDGYWNEGKQLPLQASGETTEDTEADLDNKLVDETDQKMTDYSLFLSSITYEGKVNADVHFIVSQGSNKFESNEHIDKEMEIIKKRINGLTTKNCFVYKGKGLHMDFLEANNLDVNAKILLDILGPVNVKSYQ
jgi:hypothetical protein